MTSRTFFPCALQTLQHQSSPFSASASASEAPDSGPILTVFLFAPFSPPGLILRPARQAMPCWAGPSTRPILCPRYVPPPPSTMSYPTNASRWYLPLGICTCCSQLSLFLSPPRVNQNLLCRANPKGSPLLVHLLQGSPPTGMVLLDPVGPFPVAGPGSAGRRPSNTRRRDTGHRQSPGPLRHAILTSSRAGAPFLLRRIESTCLIL